jgi:hypothetical protein
MGLKTVYYQLFHRLSCLIENEMKLKINSSNELLKKVRSISLSLSYVPCISSNLLLLIISVF